MVPLLTGLCGESSPVVQARIFEYNYCLLKVVVAYSCNESSVLTVPL